jgi:polyhydroxybutyrate depolymerase
MRAVLLLILSWALVGCPADPRDDDDSANDDDAADDDDAASPGCGLAALHGSGGVNATLDAGTEGNGERGFHIVVPDDYDPDQPYKLVIGYPGTNWIGEQIRPYLGLEDGQADDEIFVYPDVQWHDFDGWGNLGGWLLGPNAAPADGMADLVFTEALLDHLQDSYCVDTDRVFVTGHSWGGDMAQVVGCFLGDVVTASAPVAANRPYWFEEGAGWSECTGDAAMWTFFGVSDDHFTSRSYPGEFGDECNDFWLQERGCTDTQGTELGIDTSGGTCWEYAGCDAPVRYCLYGPASGHQVPNYFSSEVMEWFRSF